MSSKIFEMKLQLIFGASYLVQKADILLTEPIKGIKKSKSITYITQ